MTRPIEPNLPTVWVKIQLVRSGTAYEEKTHLSEEFYNTKGTEEKEDLCKNLRQQKGNKN